MKKQMLSFLLAVVLVFSLLPAAALAEGENTETEPAAEEIPETVIEIESEEIPETVIETESEEIPETIAETEVDEIPETVIETEMEKLPEIPVKEEKEERQIQSGAQPMAVTDEGDCGDYVKWTLEGDTLSVTGTGDMWDYSSSSRPEWYTNHRLEIKKVIIGPRVTSVGSWAFQYCTNLESVTLSYSVESIEDYAFSTCYALGNITFPAALVKIGNYAFYDCRSMTEAFLPDGLTNLGAYTFYYCRSLKDITLPSSLRALGSSVFGHCEALTEIELPENLITIQTYAFNACSSLGSITIPESVTIVGKSAFTDCTSLTSIVFQGKAPSIGEDAFSGVTATVYYNADAGGWTSEVRQQYGGTITWKPLPGIHCGDYVTWSLSGTTLTISGTGDMWDYPGPSDVPWYASQHSIRTIIIEAGVTSIGDKVFDGCTSLTSVSLPDGLTRIGGHVFSGCTKLTNISIPDSVTDIGGYAFYNTGLKSIILPPNVKNLRQGAFYLCEQLSSVVLSESLQSIGEFVFGYCSELKDITFPDSLVSIGERAFIGDLLLAEIIIPAGVTSIGAYAFNSCTNLTRITFIGEAPTIGSECFREVTATVYYPGGVTWTSSVMQNYGGTLTWVCTQCGDDAYWSMEGTTLTISGTGEMWDYDLGVDDTPWYIYRDSIRTLIIEPGITYIGKDAFFNCQVLSKITFPDSLDEIGKHSFTCCYALKSVALPSGLKRLGTAAFSSCEALTDIVIPEGITSLEETFSGCTSLTGVLLPSGLTSIGGFTFNNTKLSAIDLPAGLRSIGQYAFQNCNTLTEVTIPSSVTSIGQNAFSDCTGMKEIRFEGPAPTIGENAFASVTATAYHPGSTSWTASVMQNYGGTLTWVCFKCGDNLEWTLNEEGKLTIFGTGSMWNYEWEELPPWYGKRENIRSIVIEEGATSIGKIAFYNCTKARTVSIPDSVKSIRQAAFEYCTVLSDIVLPSGLTSIGKDAFCHSGLESIHIPERITSISDNAFGDTKLESVVLPAGVTSIGNDAFNSCSNLKSIELPASLTKIGQYAFNCCRAIEEITIPGKVNSIGQYAFQECESLRKITFQGSAPSFGTGCFTNVTATAYYQDDSTWTESVKQDYGGSITWESLAPAELILYKDHLELAVGKSEQLKTNTGAPLIWTSSNEAAATVDDTGTVTAHKYGKAIITVTTLNGMASASCEVQTLFWDVADSSKYYFRHVYWAAEKGITKGYNLEYFAPQEECTREQMITFLWRLAGQPNPKTSKSPFPDVTKSDYFYKAVLWGVDNKITNGYSEGEYAGKFGVGLPCTREQAMTFLWRMAGKPAPGTNVNPFSDIRSTDYFYKAVLWASKNGIANGYADGTYGYGVPCLREHMVTFLSRYASKFMK